MLVVPAFLISSENCPSPPTTQYPMGWGVGQVESEEKYLVRIGEGETRESQGRDPGKPTHTDVGELPRL